MNVHSWKEYEYSPLKIWILIGAVENREASGQYPPQTLRDGISTRIPKPFTLLSYSINSNNDDDDDDDDNNNNNNNNNSATRSSEALSYQQTNRRTFRTLTSTKWHLPEKKERKTYNIDIEALRYHTSTDPVEALINEEDNQQTQTPTRPLHTHIAEPIPRQLLVPRHVNLLALNSAIRQCPLTTGVLISP